MDLPGNESSNCTVTQELNPDIINEILLENEMAGGNISEYRSQISKKYAKQADKNVTSNYYRGLILLIPIIIYVLLTLYGSIDDKNWFESNKNKRFDSGSVYFIIIAIIIIAALGIGHIFNLNFATNYSQLPPTLTTTIGIWSSTLSFLFAWLAKPISLDTHSLIVGIVFSCIAIFLLIIGFILLYNKMLWLTFFPFIVLNVFFMLEYIKF